MQPRGMMRPIDDASRRPVLRNQDLVLLPVLRALLVERSVTRAGESIGLSQPATSAALARLRRRFDDELLVRVGREYDLTPFAATLLARLETVTEALSQFFAEDFDPGTTTRVFSLTASDYVTAVLSEEVNKVLTVAGRGRASIELRQPTADVLSDLDGVMRQHDGLVMPRESVRDYPGIELLRDRWVCIVAASNDAIGAALTEDDLVRRPLVAPFGQDPLHFPPLRELRRLGLEPRVEAITDSFMTVPFLVAGSDRIAFLHERLARLLVPVVPIRVLASPIDLGEVSLAMHWHPTLTDDPAHRWFRQLIALGAERVMLQAPKPLPGVAATG